MCFSDMLISFFLSSTLSISNCFAGGKRRSSVILNAEESRTAGKSWREGVRKRPPDTQTNLLRSCLFDRRYAAVRSPQRSEAEVLNSRRRIWHWTQCQDYRKIKHWIYIFHFDFTWETAPRLLSQNQTLDLHFHLDFIWDTVPKLLQKSNAEFIYKIHIIYKFMISILRLMQNVFLACLCVYRFGYTCGS